MIQIALVKKKNCLGLFVYLSLSSRTQNQIYGSMKMRIKSNKNAMLKGTCVEEMRVPLLSKVTKPK